MRRLLFVLTLLLFGVAQSVMPAGAASGRLAEPGAAEATMTDTACDPHCMDESGMVSAAADTCQACPVAPAIPAVSGAVAAPVPADGRALSGHGQRLQALSIAPPDRPPSPC